MLQEQSTKKPHFNVGRKHTEETKAYLRLVNLGKKRTDETREKISQVQRGKKHTPERIANIRAGLNPRRVTADGVVYDGVYEVCIALKVSPALVYGRIRSTNFMTWNFVEET